MFWKDAAKLVLHHFGGLTVLRWKHRAGFRILTFHEFSSSTCANLDCICAHIARHFEPVPLSRIAGALEAGAALPENAVTVTVDDGYRNFLEHGHPVFRKHRIPTTIYAVSGFSEGLFWLWFDRLEFSLAHTAKSSLRATVDGKPFELPLGSAAERTSAFETLVELLKEVPNNQRLEFVAGLDAMCEVEIPTRPPAHCAAMSWDDLRAVASEGVEIGCHTASHPILSRISDPADLEREIRGAKQLMEERLGFPVRHFCYPNGRDMDIGEAAARAVRQAGYASAVTTSCGLNAARADRMRLRRVSFESSLPLTYGAELLVGLHM